MDYPRPYYDSVTIFDFRNFWLVFRAGSPGTRYIGIIAEWKFIIRELYPRFFV